ncbi:MAG: mechanosensitive ion channel [Gammaproteobacteria bacterium]|nr:mechanosensitive ion channel [Gammaproteobacteria bacterium]
MTATTNRLLAGLLGVLLATHSFAQIAVDAPEEQAPELGSLASTWWSDLEGSGDGSKQRIEAFLADAAVQVAGLQAADRALGQSILAAASDNIRAYQALSDEAELSPQILPEPALSYSIDDLLELAAESRGASVTATQELLDVEREQRTLAGATRRRDLAFKNYVNAAAGDEKILAALTLIQNRSAQAIAARRLQILTQRYELANAYANAAAVRVEFATDRLLTTLDANGLEALSENVAGQAALVEERREQLRAAELAAAGLDLDTERGRSEQQLQQQKQVDAAVSLALAEVALAEAQARRWWTELQLAAPDMDLLEAQVIEWSALRQRVESSSIEWRRDSENELLLVQTMSREGLDRASRRLLDQRLGTAQVTLNQIGELSGAAADQELISLAVDKAVTNYSGALSSWFSGVSRNLKAGWSKVTGWADVTLFSVGGTPVTGEDVFTVFFILLFAFLLSRGIRHAINRFSRGESAGTQASLYTVGRLTHYTIISIGVFVALSSVGLDFSKLALIAGALSVGIGFGLQSIVSNFVSGLIILFEQSLRVGDYIELDTGLTGTVKAINVRSTLINTNDNIDIVVPNSEFVTTRLTNWTLGERILRVRIPFGVAYGSDKELVRKAAQEAAAEVQYTLKHMRGREPDVWLVEFGDSSLNFLLLVWVNREGARRPTRTRAAYLWALETKLNEYGIEIPFPQRDLNLRHGWPGQQADLQELSDDNEQQQEKDEE